MMTLPRTVADVLSDHVTFEVECIDRMYLNVWVPRLAYGGGVAGFFVGHRGNRYASTALMDPMSKAFRDRHSRLHRPRAGGVSCRMSTDPLGRPGFSVLSCLLSSEGWNARKHAFVSWRRSP